jgi:hypothetical protein
MTCYGDNFFSSFYAYSRDTWGWYLDYTTRTPYQISSHSLFTNEPTIRLFMFWGASSVIKEITEMHWINQLDVLRPNVAPYSRTSLSSCMDWKNSAVQVLQRWCMTQKEQEAWNFLELKTWIQRSQQMKLWTRRMELYLALTAAYVREFILFYNYLIFHCYCRSSSWYRCIPLTLYSVNMNCNGIVI